MAAGCAFRGPRSSRRAALESEGRARVGGPRSNRAALAPHHGPCTRHGAPVFFLCNLRFGRTQKQVFVEDAKAFVSCCVEVTNLQRDLFVLPRACKLDARGNETVRRRARSWA